MEIIKKRKQKKNSEPKKVCDSWPSIDFFETHSLHLDLILFEKKTPKRFSAFLLP